MRFGPGTAASCATKTKQPVQIADIRAEPAYANDPQRLAILELAGARTMLAVPMLKEDDVVGVIWIYRQEVQPFTDKQIALMQNFAAQAVIAIENARLLSELRQRTDDLSESLQQQTATADVLKVISRSTFDLQTVLNTLIKSAAELCAADKAVVFQQEGEALPFVANYRFSAEAERHWVEHPPPVDRVSVTGRALLEGRAVQVADVLTDSDYRASRHRALELAGYRTVLAVPLLRGGTAIGVFGLTRDEVNPFTEKQIELVTTFADQAVIAIENVRLFEAEQQRTRELTESLEQQTATSEVLRVISSSRGALQPVFAAMLANAARICEAQYGLLWLVEADGFRPVAHHGLQAPERGYPVDRVLRPEPDLPLARLARSKQVVHVLDARTEPAYIRGYPPFLPLIDIGGARTLLLVPMLKEDVLVGAIAIYRQEVRPFTEKQIALVANFASQAVIAIESTRLLNELRESLQQQTATADVLKVISRSAFGLRTVLDTLLQTAARLCDAEQGMITQRKGDSFYRSVSYGFPTAFAEYVKAQPVEVGRDTATGRALLEGKVIHIPDVSG
jgi:GAF domain-containing protein